MVPPQIWWFGYFGRRRPKSTRAYPGQLWSRVTKVNQDLPGQLWSRATKANQDLPWYFLVWGLDMVPPQIWWFGYFGWRRPKSTRKFLVDFGYPGPELTMASPGWLSLPWTKINHSNSLSALVPLDKGWLGNSWLALVTLDQVQGNQSQPELPGQRFGKKSKYWTWVGICINVFFFLSRKYLQYLT